MGKFITSEFARVRCAVCKEVLDTLNPGREFDSIKECNCQKEEVIDYEELEIEELREILKTKNIPFSSQAGKPTLIKKIKGA
jgi:hypothetical protein